MGEKLCDWCRKKFPVIKNSEGFNFCSEKCGKKFEARLDKLGKPENQNKCEFC